MFNIIYVATLVLKYTNKLKFLFFFSFSFFFSFFFFLIIISSVLCSSSKDYKLFTETRVQDFSKEIWSVIIKILRAMENPINQARRKLYLYFKSAICIKLVNYI